VFVVFPRIVLLDLAGPLQVLSWVRDPVTHALVYHISIAAEDAGRILSDSYLSIDAEDISDWVDRDIDTLIVVGGDGVYLAEKSHDFVP